MTTPTTIAPSWKPPSPASTNAPAPTPEALGERPVPVRLHILDTMRAVEAALTACTDDIAHQFQRAPVAMPSARRATYASDREARLAYEDRQRLAVLARADLAAPWRWRHTGHRDAVRAALWLLARVEFAAGAAERVERALDIAVQSRTLARPCSGGGGEIEMHGGEGRPPVARCTGCGHI
ncbi:hypothetical protein [Streptomyces sp. NPDC016845]|uniref:hypothetical protein n=1 Tax=Streptomyces sp. NPDC016845 TaxID=3364972 RepID=UPI0037B9C2DC